MARRQWGQKAPKEPEKPSSAAWSGDTSLVDKSVSASVQRYLNKPADLTPGSVPAIGSVIAQLGTARVRELLESAGVTRSASTIRRWKKTGHVPDLKPEEVAQLKSKVQPEELLHRNVQIDKLGGPKAAAAQLGVAESTIKRYAAGKTKHLRSKELSSAVSQADKAAVAASFGMNIGGAPKIEVRGQLSICIPGKEAYKIQYRNITMTVSNASISAQQNEQLYDAYLNDDFDAITAQLEVILTTAYFSANYADFNYYSEDNRVEINHLDYFTLDWRQ